MPEKEAFNIHEAHEHAEVVQSERKLAPISVTMAVLAVLIAAISLLGHRAHNEVLLAQMRANFHTEAAEIAEGISRQKDLLLLILTVTSHDTSL